MDCENKVACYDLQLRGLDGPEWKLQNQNYRLYYDSRFSTYIEGSARSLLPTEHYSELAELRSVSGMDASAFEGGLIFDKHLGFLNFYIDFPGYENATIVSPGDEWITTVNVCFNIHADLDTLSSEYLDMVWAREDMTSSYSPAYTIIGGTQDNGDRVLPEFGVFNDLDFANPAHSAPWQNCSLQEGVENGAIVLSGVVAEPNDNPLEGVHIVAGAPYYLVDTTSHDGKYSISTHGSAPVEIRPFKNDDLRKGIDEDDYDWLLGYIEGNRSFKDPYQYFAADINNDKVIDLMDALLLLQVMMGVRDEFPNNTSYRFLAKNQDILDPDIQNPLIMGYDESYVVNPQFDVLENLDFTAIKVGDITGTICIACDKSTSYHVEETQLSSNLFDSNTKMNVYPNPNFGEMTITQESTIERENETISIFNMEGKRVHFETRYVENTLADSYKINRPDLEEGIYYLIIQSPHKKQTTTFTIID